MKAHIQVFMLNALYSEEEARINHAGEESEDNRKFLWEDEFEILAKRIEVHSREGDTYSLIGQRGNGEPFEEFVPDMRVFEFRKDDGLTGIIACSESLIDSHSLESNEDTHKLCLFLKDNEPFANPLPGIYISSSDFPEGLSHD